MCVCVGGMDENKKCVCWGLEQEMCVCVCVCVCGCVIALIVITIVKEMHGWTV